MDLYNKLFHVDIEAIAMAKGRKLPNQWGFDIFALTLKDVKAENLLKFEWKVAEGH